MKTFYLLRHEDLHSNSGLGVVAEGVIFDTGLVALTWLSKYSSVTIFDEVKTVIELHGHEGRTEIIIEGKDKRFNDCKDKARLKKTQAKRNV